MPARVRICTAAASGYEIKLGVKESAHENVRTANRKPMQQMNSNQPVAAEVPTVEIAAPKNVGNLSETINLTSDVLCTDGAGKPSRPFQTETATTEAMTSWDGQFKFNCHLHLLHELGVSHLLDRTSTARHLDLAGVSNLQNRMTSGTSAACRAPREIHHVCFPDPAYPNQCASEDLAVGMGSQYGLR